MKTSYPTKKLGEIVDFQNGLWTGKRPPFIKVPVLRNTNFKNGNGTLNFDDVAEIEVESRQLETRYLSPGDIILERSGGGPDQPVGRVVYFDQENNKYSYSNFTTRIRIRDKRADNKYIWRYLDYFYRIGGTEAMQKKTTGIRNLTFSEYKQIEIPLPPLPIQKKIVKKIEELFGKINKAQKIREEALKDAEALVPAALHQVFEKRKKRGWLKESLTEACRVVTDGTHDTPQYHENGIPLVTSKNLLSSGLSFGNVKYISEKDHLEISKRSGVNKGDILIAMIGTIGNVTIIDTDRIFSIKNVGLLKPNENKVIGKYLFYYLQNSRLLNLVGTGGTTQKFISLGSIRNIQILYPPLPEQKKIVAYLDSLSEKARKLQDLQKQTAEDLKALKQSILDKAFKEELVK